MWKYWNWKRCNELPFTFLHSYFNSKTRISHDIHASINTIDIGFLNEDYSPETSHWTNWSTRKRAVGIHANATHVGRPRYYSQSHLFTLSALPSLYIYNVQRSRPIHVLLICLWRVFSHISDYALQLAPITLFSCTGNNGKALSTRRHNSQLGRNHPRRSKHHRPLSLCVARSYRAWNTWKHPRRSQSLSITFARNRRWSAALSSCRLTGVPVNVFHDDRRCHNSYPGQACPHAEAPEARTTWASRRSASV